MITLGILIGTLQIGGTELQLLQLLKNIDRTKFKPIIFTLHDAGELEHQMKYIGIEVFPLRIKKKNLLPSLFNTYHIIRSHRIDILYCLLNNPIIVGSVIGRLACIKYIVGGLRGLGMSWSRQQIWGIRFTQLLVTSFIVNSEAVKKVRVDREWINSNKIEIIPNGINLSSYSYTVEKQKIVGIVGSLKPIKGQMQFVQAAHSLLKKGFNYKFMLLGDGPDRFKLYSLVKSFGRQKDIIFQGNVINVNDYIKKFKLLICASAYEGLSNAIIEAMAVGTPVIASNIPGNRCIIKHMDNGVLFEFGNVEDLSEKIIYMDNQPELYKFIQENGRATVEARYNLIQMVTKTQQHFLRLKNHGLW